MICSKKTLTPLDMNNWTMDSDLYNISVFRHKGKRQLCVRQKLLSAKVRVKLLSAAVFILTLIGTSRFELKLARQS